MFARTTTMPLPSMDSTYGAWLIALFLETMCVHHPLKLPRITQRPILQSLRHWDLADLLLFSLVAGR
jgi:hypothetical protein